MDCFLLIRFKVNYYVKIKRGQENKLQKGCAGQDTESSQYSAATTSFSRSMEQNKNKKNLQLLLCLSVLLLQNLQCVRAGQVPYLSLEQDTLPTYTDLFQLVCIHIRTQTILCVHKKTTNTKKQRKRAIKYRIKSTSHTT